ncbi:MAG: 3-deoxy-D-manno-octulosonate 8-phosphate phosphatase [Clostridia bacterium]
MKYCNKNDIKLLVLDVDGTLTDGKVYMGADGEVMKAFDIKDGCGIYDILPNVSVNWIKENKKFAIEDQLQGIVPIIITARSSQLLKNRCNELKIKYLYQNCRNKVDKLREIANKFNCHPDETGVYANIAYMGDDIIDIPAMNICGIKACPSDATKKVIDISDFISTKKGGDGAVREFIEWIIA